MHGATRSLEPSQRSPPPFCTAGKADAVPIHIAEFQPRKGASFVVEQFSLIAMFGHA